MLHSKEIEIQLTAKVTPGHLCVAHSNAVTQPPKAPKKSKDPKHLGQEQSPEPSTNPQNPSTTQTPQDSWKLNRMAYRQIKTTIFNSCFCTGTNCLRINPLWQSSKLSETEQMLICQHIQTLRTRRYKVKMTLKMSIFPSICVKPLYVKSIFCAHLESV